MSIGKTSRRLNDFFCSCSRLQKERTRLSELQVQKLKLEAEKNKILKKVANMEKLH